MVRERIELPRVSDSETNAMERRLRGMLVREGLPYNAEVEALGFGKEEVMCRLEDESAIERWNPDITATPRAVLDVKEGLNEIVTNYLTGMGLSGNWVDSDPNYSRIFHISKSFLDEYAKRMLSHGGKYKTEKQATTRVVKALAYEYMKPIDSGLPDGDLKGDLLYLFSDKLPRYILISETSPLDILDSILVRYVLEDSSKNDFPPSTDTSDIGIMIGYQDYMRGKIYALPESRTKAERRQRERVIMHEMLHLLSTSTNKEAPEHWVGKVGLKRFLAV